MIPAGFKASLVTYGETISGGKAAIEDEWEALFARVNANKGTEIIDSSVNGKSFGYEVTMTVEEKFAVFGEALRELNAGEEIGGAIVSTQPDFRGLRL